ncbi:ParB N-terminal domain-containing protein [Actinomyces provencensis]|uniref:ParB N-terminal domain-containing protein n=1 Tax=Actinomyces provencensis TaxID=1720198 RepID=UPI00096A8FF3|nr:ParB N-terminal domain-containing protein [Actinomyces provencensis]
MTAATGHIELDRTVESIQVGRRHRHDLGDLDALAASIDRDGLLQPITITPDGVLVCGMRRLAAIRQLGWRTVNVWVRSSISDRLGHLLAEQDDNQLHKTLSPLEAAGLYREIKTLMAEDAARREAAGQFTSDYQPRWNGPVESAEPLATPAGDTRRQAAQMVTGANSYTRLEQIGYLQHLVADPDTPEPLRIEAQAGLTQIEAGGPVDPAYQRVRDIHQTSDTARDEHLHDLAEQALARIDASAPKNGKPKSKAGKATPAVPDARYAVRAFVLTWAELDSWWLHYDLDELATQLTDEQVESFYATVEGTQQFAGRLRAAREHAAERPHLRAL